MTDFTSMTFYKETDFQETTIGKIPKDWKVAQLGDLFIAEIILGQSPPSSTYNKEGKGLPFLQGKMEFGKTYPSSTSFCSEPAKIAESSDILLSVRAPVGAVNIAQRRYCIGRGLAAIRPKRKNLNHLFLFYSLCFAEKKFGSISMGSTFKAIRKHEIERFSIPLPILQEQQKIAEVLSVVDLAIQKTDEVIAKTERLKKGLMQQLLTKGIGHKEFKDTKVGRIPKEWKVYKLNYLIEKGIITYHLDGNHGELYPRAQEFVGEGVPFLSANMISNGNIDFSKAKYVTEERARQFRKGVAKDGDVLFAHNATVGPVVILKTDLPYVILGTTLTSYRCNSSYLNNQYLKRYMEGPFFQQQLQRIMKQTTRNQVPITAQRKLQFVVPILDEQQRIAEPLDAIDEKLELERKERTTLNRIKLGLMDLLLTGKIRVKVS